MSFGNIVVSVYSTAVKSEKDGYDQCIGNLVNRLWNFAHYYIFFDLTKLVLYLQNLIKMVFF